MSAPHEPQRVTPAMIRTVEFARVRRGADEHQVRGFLLQVEQELHQILNERAALADEVARLRHRLDAAGTSESMRPQEAHLQAVRILSQAQQTADRYVADAERYTRDLTSEARRHRDEILADARTRAVRVLEEAHTQAAEVPAPLPPPPPPPPAPPAREPSEARDDLEKELAHLRVTTEVYRTHLRSYLTALLDNVDSWEKPSV